MSKAVRIVLIVTLLMTVSTAIHAKQKAIQVDPLALRDGLLNAQYEWAVKSDQTLMVSSAFAGGGSGGSSASLIMAGFGLNKYFSAKALSGLYAGGSASVASLSVKDGGESGHLLALFLGGTAGYKLDLGSSFFVDGSVNVTMPVIAHASADGQSGTAAGFGGVATALGIGVGYSW